MKVAIPKDNETHLSMMFQDLNVTANSNLELLFTCFVMSWAEEIGGGVSKELKNPTFQILYDDVLVFNMDSALTKPNKEEYTLNEWNQFRLFSR